ncbi:voltage-gated ClC-type chloride channel ClcB [Escherichia coli]|nr:voltage-gated ClC-type chloride channel ClcB [Escherichia coli]EFH5176307.1 voltage-gated ClC-type chloride channel ClcB [Escherichia coli]EFI3624659.1 voltage-gated ClC-type chloride channel ClcB [Escherichia coli]EHO4012316.1 voltage-gated ClC-type chloride channel ClcB [Escherichia coli]EIT7611179.1 voltage-gated ClC-type chloride channel ClcB [Escherichia coli]
MHHLHIYPDLRTMFRRLLIATVVGILAAFAVAGFRHAMLLLEWLFLNNDSGSLVNAATNLSPWRRLLTPALGGLAAGLLLMGWQKFTQQRPHAPTDYMEALQTDGQFDYAASLVKSLASLLVVTSGSAIGREGAMILLAALAASCFAQRFTPRQEWKLWIACGAAAGMAAAYRAPLAGSLFIAEVLFGTMMLASLGPVIISAVVALLVSNLINHSDALLYNVQLSISAVVALLVSNLINHSDALLYNVQLSVTVQARDYALIISTGVLAGLCGPLLLTLMNACHRGFVSLKLAPPWQLALGGLIVGLLSLFTPAVWGNGYSTVQSFLTAPPLLMIIAGIFLCKLCAVLASSGSGAPGGVFTPTLFIGLAIGMLYGRSLGLWFPDGEEITLLLGLTGMATLLAATTHAPIMSTLMICEMTGEYQLLPGLLIACVIASVISRTLHRDSIYRQHTAQHS